MATNNGSYRETTNDVESGFFKLGEIRAATDKDFEYFLNLADNNSGWIKKVETSELTIWQKESKDSTVKMIKVLGQVKNVKPSTAFDVLLDGTYRRSWDDSVIEDIDFCKLNDFNDIGYFAMKWPTPLKNRDFVNQRSWRIYNDDQFVIFNHSVVHPQYPPKKNFIRGFSYITGFLIRKVEGGCSMVYLTQSDPRGRIPKWIINLALNKLAPAVFKQLYTATLQYEEWKSKNDPLHKPWRNPEQNLLPMADLSLFQSSSEACLNLADNNGDQDEEVPTEDALEEFVEHLAESLEIKTEIEDNLPST